VDRTRVQGRLRKPLRDDRAAASSGAGTPQAPGVSRKLDPIKQRAIIDAYAALLRTPPDDETVMFADAVHPTHGARPVGAQGGRGHGHSRPGDRPDSYDRGGNGRRLEHDRPPDRGRGPVSVFMENGFADSLWSKQAVGL